MADKDLRLLSVDGGGVRGLSALMILERLMEAIEPENPPKPCDYFDMIGGTSTGGLIAIMLGRLKMSINECIEAYLLLSDRIFEKKQHRVTIKGKVQGRFDSEELARAVKEVVAGQGLQDALLKDTSENACKVFVCATSKETGETVCLTSYKSPRGDGDLLNSVKIWEACRATSAASSFFDPIAIGRYKEEFVDGATGANNPVWEIWNQAQSIWGSQPLENRLQCLVSIGTGIPLLKPFKDDVLDMIPTLVAIATETEQSAERFRRDKSSLNDSGRYYRFNVNRGLEEVGLEESKKRKEIAAATRRYIGTQDVFKQIQAFASNIAGRENLRNYLVPFTIEGIPKVNEFVERPVEMAELEQGLLAEHQIRRQKVFVLHGLGGIGKSQLAVEFARKHHRKFSAVFWLDGSSRDSVKQSIAGLLSRIPQNQISESIKAFIATGNADIDMIVREVLDWLARQDNTNWLLIFDNVDRDYTHHDSDPDAYDVKSYFSGADHGSILITTRLAKLEQLGDSQPVSRVDQNQANAIFRSRYKRKYDLAESERLLALLDGLPLAIAQAAAFIQESGVSIETYIRFYEQQWTELMNSRQWAGAPLQDYPDRSVWTTWAISYNAIRERHEATAKLLLLWAFLDNKDLWFGIFKAASNSSLAVARILSKWIGDLATNEVEFTKAMQLLRNHSLVEDARSQASYATHPVVHTWAYYFQGKDTRMQLAQLAVLVVGRAIPRDSSREYAIMQRRFLPHAHACSRWIVTGEIRRNFGTSHQIVDETETMVEQTTFLEATREVGILFRNQNQLRKAERIYLWVLESCEETLGLENEATLNIICSLGILYKDQNKLAKAEQMYQQALQDYEKMIGPEHESILDTIYNLGNLYSDQGKLVEAEQMYQRALQDTTKILGPEHISTLDTIQNLGILYKNQGKLAEAEQMYQRALQGYEKTIGPEHVETLATINNLGVLYRTQNKLVEAEQMYQRALQGFEKVLGLESAATYIPALKTIYNLGLLFKKQGDIEKARTMFYKSFRRI